MSHGLKETYDSKETQFLARIFKVKCIFTQFLNHFFPFQDPKRTHSSSDLYYRYRPFMSSWDLLSWSHLLFSSSRAVSPNLTVKLRLKLQSKTMEQNYSPRRWSDAKPNLAEITIKNKVAIFKEGWSRGRIMILQLTFIKVTFFLNFLKWMDDVNRIHNFKNTFDSFVQEFHSKMRQECW